MKSSRVCKQVQEPPAGGKRALFRIAYKQQRHLVVWKWDGEIAIITKRRANGYV